MGKDDGHPVVDFRHEIVRIGRDDRAGFQDVTVWRSPMFPQTGENQRLAIILKDVPRLFCFAPKMLPFVKAGRGNQASLFPECSPESRFDRDCVAAGIDHMSCPRRVLGPTGNQTPLHRFRQSNTVRLDANHQDLLQGSQVKTRFPFRLTKQVEEFSQFGGCRPEVDSSAHGPRRPSRNLPEIVTLCRRENCTHSAKIMPKELFPEDVTMSTGPESDLIDVLRLNLVPGLGPRTYQLLLERFGSPRGILEASVSKLQEVNNVGPKLAMSVVTHGTEAAAREELKKTREAGVTLFIRDTAGYPAVLGRIPDPPTVIYCKGTLVEADGLSVGIVGSRHCTAYGRQQAHRLAQALARMGITVVSGLARGIDAEAHKGAIEGGGRTIAVCATGLNTVYPPEHVDLAAMVIKQGCLLTESPMDQAPKSGLFPQRNRIISGLSLGVVLIEAGRSSGALHTARHAMEQNREVFAMPGRVDSEASLGCLDLIRDGATLIRGVDDVLSALGPLVTPVQRTATETIRKPAELTLSDQEKMILNLVPAESIPIDEVIRAANLETSRVLSTLTVLEMKRLVRRLPGGFIARY